jgi:hypothetical protein
VFVVPKREIIAPDDMPKWIESEAYKVGWNVEVCR